MIMAHHNRLRNKPYLHLRRQRSWSLLRSNPLREGARVGERQVTTNIRESSATGGLVCVMLESYQQTRRYSVQNADLFWQKSTLCDRYRNPGDGKKVHLGIQHNSRNRHHTHPRKLGRPHRCHSDADIAVMTPQEAWRKCLG